MITYAAYAGRQIRLFEAAIVTIITDTAASFLAGFAIFPVVFAEKLDPSSGPGLMFVTLPLAFARIPFGTIAAWAFFALVVVAALGSAISLLELVVALVRHALGLSRAVATALCAATCWMLGLGTVFSFNLWASWYPLAAFPGFAKATLFDLVDHLTSNLLLPIAGFLLALFAGWIIPTRLLGEELALRDQALAVIRLLLRYFVPFAIAAATIVPLVR